MSTEIASEPVALWQVIAASPIYRSNGSNFYLHALEDLWAILDNFSLKCVLSFLLSFPVPHSLDLDISLLLTPHALSIFLSNAQSVIAAVIVGQWHLDWQFLNGTESITWRCRGLAVCRQLRCCSEYSTESGMIWPLQYEDGTQVKIAILHVSCIQSALSHCRV